MKKGCRLRLSEEAGPGAVGGLMRTIPAGRGVVIGGARIRTRFWSRIPAEYCQIQGFSDFRNSY